MVLAPATSHEHSIGTERAKVTAPAMSFEDPVTSAKPFYWL